MLLETGPSCAKHGAFTALVLYEDLRSDEFRVMENAIYTLVGIGQEEGIDMLEAFLRSVEFKEVADVYLNSGSSRLRGAAQEWAKKRGYGISSTPGGPEVTWGQEHK